MTTPITQTGLVAELVVQQPFARVVEVVTSGAIQTGISIPFRGPTGAVLVKTEDASAWLEVDDLTTWFDNQLA